MNKKVNRLPMAGHEASEIYDTINIPRTIKFSYNHIVTINERKHKAGYRDFSTFGRDCMLNTQILARITPVQMKLINALIRERNNINQIAKACNAGKCWIVVNEALSVLRGMDSIINYFNRTKP